MKVYLLTITTEYGSWSEGKETHVFASETGAMKFLAAWAWERSDYYRDPGTEDAPAGIIKAHFKNNNDCWIIEEVEVRP